jgi:hypothetical protein
MPPDQRSREGDENQQSHGDDVQVWSTQEPGPEPEEEGSADDREPSPGEQVYPFTGTGTSSRTSTRMVSDDRALIAASAETMSRWARTGTARPFTSSGIA